MSEQRCAHRVEAAALIFELEPYSASWGYGILVDEYQLADVLADLRHFADANNIDFFKALDKGYNYYLEEI